VIDDPAKAKRLAGAICADLKLYHRAKIEALAPAERTQALAAPVAEAYELYFSRVAEAHRGLFEEAVVAMYAELGAPYHGLPTAFGKVPTGSHPPLPMRAEPSVAAPLLITLGVLAFAIAAGVAAFFAQSH
jgi:hypothetical protein